MEGATFKLNIISPEKILFSGEVVAVALPGSKEPFTVLHNHAPIISTLSKGVIRWKAETPGEQKIVNGFVEVKNNVVTACVEVKG